MNLQDLSDADLMALKAGDLSKVSDAGLMSLKGSAAIPIKGERLKHASDSWLTNASIPQPIVDVAAGASGLMRGGANLISEGLGEKMWPTRDASKESGWRTAGSFADP